MMKKTLTLSAILLAALIPLYLAAQESPETPETPVTEIVAEEEAPAAETPAEEPALEIPAADVPSLRIQISAPPIKETVGFPLTETKTVTETPLSPEWDAKCEAAKKESGHDPQATKLLSENRNYSFLVSAPATTADGTVSLPTENTAMTLPPGIIMFSETGLSDPHHPQQIRFLIPPDGVIISSMSADAQAGPSANVMFRVTGARPEAGKIMFHQAKPDQPAFRIHIQKDKMLKPGEVSVTTDADGTHQVRVYPDMPHEKLRRELEKQIPGFTPAAAKVTFSAAGNENPETGKFFMFQPVNSGQPPFRVRIQKDATLQPGEIFVTADADGTHQVRVHPDMPHNKIHEELKKRTPGFTPPEGNVMYFSGNAAGITKVAVPTGMPGMPPVDPDFIQLLNARLQHAAEVYKSVQARHQAGAPGVTDVDVSAAELAVKEARFALKKATQPMPIPPMMPPIPMPGMPPHVIAAKPLPAAPPMNPELAEIRKEHLAQLAEQLMGIQEEFAVREAAFLSGEEEDGDAAAYLRAKILYLNTAARYYQEAGIRDRLAETLQNRVKTAMLLTNVLGENLKKEGLGDKARAKLEKQLKNAKIILMEAVSENPGPMPPKK